MSIAEKIIDEIAEICVEEANSWKFVRDKLTPGMAQAFFIQHSLRNIWFSSQLRPAWMSRCPDQAVVRKTIGQMMEEIVYDKNIDGPHTTLLRKMAGYLGVPEKGILEAKPTWQSDLWHNVNENLCRNRHWIIGWLATSLEEFVLIQPGFNVLHSDRWMSDLGLTKKQVWFLEYHHVADLEHAGKRVWAPIRNHVDSKELRDDVMSGLKTALAVNKIFYEGVAELGAELDAQGAAIAKAG